VDDQRDESSFGPASFERVDRDAEPTLVVTGEIDVSVRADFRGQLAALVAEAPSPGLVDLSAVTFMDSSGLGELVSAKVAADAVGVELILVRPSEPVRRVLSLTGIDQMLTIRD